MKSKPARKAVCSTSDLLLHLYWITKTIPYDMEELDMEQFEKYLAALRIVDALEPLLMMHKSDVDTLIDSRNSHNQVDNTPAKR